MQSNSSYETVPYLSKFFIQTHPEHLVVLGTLFGMQPQNVEKCRVLELGCGNGSNLIAHAFSLPDSEFVGVDLAQSHIVEANKSIQDLELTNIKFYQLDLMEMSAEKFGMFDYIIAHGLFSWIPDFVREKVLEIYHEMLSPNGIGYISYNVYPGNHLRKLAQKPMQFVTAKFSDPVEKVNNAVSFLKFLSEETTETDVFQLILQAELENIVQRLLPDIFHDDLAEINQPFYFTEFVEQLKKQNLQFLSETKLSMMSTQSFSPRAKSFLESHENIIEREQYIDFLRNRYFRKSLICHSEITLNHQPVPELLDKFLVVSSVRPANKKPNLITWGAENFVGFEGTGFEIDHPLTKMSLFILEQKWAKAIPFIELLETARQSLENEGFTTDDWKNEFEISRQILLQIYLNTEFIHLHLYQPTAKTEVSEKPEINKLARWQLGIGDSVNSLLNQNFKAADSVLRHLLHLMDGTRNREDLLLSIKEFVKTEGRIETDEEISGKLQNYLSLMARMGMFA
jgi:methyltransferase-like protein